MNPDKEFRGFVNFNKSHIKRVFQDADQTVAAGFQWLQGEKLPIKYGQFSGPGIFPSVGHRVLVREKSEAEWRSFPVNVSMYLAVQEYK